MFSICTCTRARLVTPYWNYAQRGCAMQTLRRFFQRKLRETSRGTCIMSIIVGKFLLYTARKWKESKMILDKGPTKSAMFKTVFKKVFRFGFSWSRTKAKKTPVCFTENIRTNTCFYSRSRPILRGLSDSKTSLRSRKTHNHVTHLVPMTFQNETVASRVNCGLSNSS